MKSGCEQTRVPPHRLMERVRDQPGVRMIRVDQNVLFDPGRQRLHQQQRRSPFHEPPVAIAFSCHLVTIAPWGSWYA